MCPIAVDMQISDLNPNPSPALSDVYAIDNALKVTYKNTHAQLLSLIQGNIQISESQVTNLISDLAGKSPLTGSTSLVTLGTITTGTWNGAAIGAAYGGTGFNSYTDGQLLAGQTSSGNLIKGSLVAGTGVAINFNSATGAFTISTGSSTYVTSISATAPLTVSASTGSVTVALTTPVALNFGGTNANLTASNGGIFYSTASAGAILSGTATAGKVLQSGASSAPTWSTPTYPSASGTSGKFLISDGTNNVYSTSTIPTSAGATANKVLLSDGTNYVLSTPTFPNASATSGKIIISDGTNWIASTAVYPTTTTINQLLYSSAANTISGVTAANNGVLISGTTGIPSWLAAGTTGQVLIATTSSPASWGTLSGIAVTAIIGTANQVLANGTSASPQIGAITLTLPQSIATSSNVQFGTLGLGAANAGGLLDIQGSTSAAGAIYSVLIRTNLTETSSSSGTCALFLGGTHTINGSGTNTATWIQINPTVTATTTVSTSMGLQINAGSGTGTTTAAYGIFANNPGFGTARIAIFATNLAVGTSGVSPPTNGLLVGGSILGGTTSNPTPSYAATFSVSTPRNANIVITGNSFDGSSDTDGIVLAMSHNASSNRQFCIVDSTQMASSSTNGMIRILPNFGIIDYIGTNVLTVKQMTLGSAGTGIYSPGPIGAGINSPNGALDVSINLFVSSASSPTNGVLKISSTGGINSIQSALTTTTSSAAPLLFGNYNLGSEWARFDSSGRFHVALSATTGSTAVFNVGNYDQFQSDSSGNISTFGFSNDVAATDYSAVSSTPTTVTIMYLWQFTPTVDIYIDNLGMNDAAFPSGSRNVGIYQAGGALLVSAAVAKTDPLSGKFRYRSLSVKTRLTAGITYGVGVIIINGDTTLIGPTGQTFGSEITFVSGANSGVLGSTTLPATDPTTATGVGTFPMASFTYQTVFTSFNVISSSGSAYTVGNLGIGAPATGGKLHVFGDVRFQATTLFKMTDGTGNNGFRVVGSNFYADSDVFTTRDLTFGALTASATYTTLLWVTSTSNVSFFNSGSFGSGVNVIFIANRTTAPTSNPSGGGLLYSASGAGTWRGSSGTTTTFGPADPHCPECDSDFGFEWENPKYGGNLRICAVCLSRDMGLKSYIRWNENLH